MSKQEKKPKEKPDQFKRFEALAKALVAVPGSDVPKAKTIKVMAAKVETKPGKVPRKKGQER